MTSFSSRPVDGQPDDPAHQPWADPPPSAGAARRVLPGPAGSPALDRIAALAARLLDVSSAQVSLLTDVQTVAAGSGLAPGAVGSTGPLEDSLCTVTARAAQPLVVPLAVDDDRVNSLPPVTSGQVGAYLGVPLHAATGEITGAVCVFDAAPHRWSERDVTVLQQLAESVQAELELIGLGRDFTLSQARVDLAAQAADIGSFDWNIGTGRIDCDERMLSLYGYDSGGVSNPDGASIPRDGNIPGSGRAAAARFDRTIDSLRSRLHPDDVELVTAAIRVSIAETDTLQLRYRIVVPEHGVRWLETRGRALTDNAGAASQMLGVTWDVTDRFEAERGADRVLASMSIGYLGMDADFVVTFVNPEGQRLLGSDAARMVGHRIWDLFPATVGTEYERVYRRVAATKTPETLESFYPAPLNAWYEIRVVPTPDGIALYFLDITTRHNSQQLVELSVDAATSLFAVNTAPDAASALAEVSVPRLGDWAVVSLLESDGLPRDVATRHRDPAMLEVLHRYSTSRLDGGGSGAIDAVIGTGEPLVLPNGVLDYANATMTSPVAKQALAELAPRSAVVVPLITEGNVTGVLTLARGADRQALTAQELAVTVSTCRRAGLAIDNARLRAAQAEAAARDRTAAQTLQQALLTQLPKPDHLNLAARYLTAADGDQVGGDWYDAVIDANGATTVMIGDVTGHDIRAAAIMGQLRTILRVFALDDQTPATTLQRVDEAAHTLELATLATAVTARIEQPPDDQAEGLRTLRWSNAGHPPPVLLLPDGRTVLLTGTDNQANDPPLGVTPKRQRRNHTHTIEPGATLVLYTDGLVETRTADIDTGINRLRESLSRHHDLDTEELLDAVLRDLVGAQPEDDTALLAVRFNSET